MPLRPEYVKKDTASKIRQPDAEIGISFGGSGLMNLLIGNRIPNPEIDISFLSWITQINNAPEIDIAFAWS